MSRSRHRNRYDDYDTEEVVEKFNSRRRSKLKKKTDHESVGYDTEEEKLDEGF